MLYTHSDIDIILYEHIILSLSFITKQNKTMHNIPSHSRMYRALCHRRMMRTVRAAARVAIVAAMIPALYLAACILLLAFPPVL